MEKQTAQFTVKSIVSIELYQTYTIKDVEAFKQKFEEEGINGLEMFMESGLLEGCVFDDGLVRYEQQEEGSIIEDNPDYVYIDVDSEDTELCDMLNNLD